MAKTRFARTSRLSEISGHPVDWRVTGAQSVSAIFVRHLLETSDLSFERGFGSRWLLLGGNAALSPVIMGIVKRFTFIGPC